MAVAMAGTAVAIIYSRWGKRTLAQTQAARSPNGSNGHVPPAPPASV